MGLLNNLLHHSFATESIHCYQTAAPMGLLNNLLHHSFATESIHCYQNAALWGFK
jgi:hypothetical protein